VSGVEPVDGVAEAGECDHEDVDVVVSSERVLVGVDEVVGEFIADGVHGGLGVVFLAQQVVHAVQPALQREERLLLEINLLLLHPAIMNYQPLLFNSLYSTPPPTTLNTPTSPPFLTSSYCCSHIQLLSSCYLAIAFFRLPVGILWLRVSLSNTYYNCP